MDTTLIVGPHGKGKGGFAKKRHLYAFASPEGIRHFIEKISSSLTLEIVETRETGGKYVVICKLLEGHHPMLDVPHTKKIDVNFLETL